MTSRIPSLLVALFVVGVLLAPQQTGAFVSSSVTAGWHAVQTAVGVATRK